MNLITDYFIIQEWARYRERQRLRELEKQEKTQVFHRKHTTSKNELQEQLEVVPTRNSTEKEEKEKQDMHKHKNPSHTAFYSPTQNQMQCSPRHPKAKNKLYTPPYNDEDSEDDDIEEYGRRATPSTPSAQHFNHNIFANTGHHNFIPRHLSPAIIKSIKQSRTQHESSGGNDLGDYKCHPDDSSEDDSLSDKVHQYIKNRRQEFGERNRKEKNSVVKKREKSSFGKKYGKDKKSVGRWTYEEKLAFLNGMKQYGIGKWSKIARTIPTRNTMQVKTHGQSMFKQCGEKEDIIKYLEKHVEEFRLKKSLPKKDYDSRHTTKVVEEASLKEQPTKSSTRSSSKDLEDDANETGRNEMYSFQKNIATLKEFREKHGHCSIPKNHPDQTLYHWTQRMGMSYRFIQEGKKPPYNLQPDEIKQLADLDFDFRKSKKKSWDTWFKQLEEYKKRHGHVNVRKTKEDTPLYMWCYRMNCAYNERKRNRKPRYSSLSKEREQKLLDIGFKFSTVKP